MNDQRLNLREISSGVFSMGNGILGPYFDQDMRHKSDRYTRARVHPDRRVEQVGV